MPVASEFFISANHVLSVVTKVCFDIDGTPACTTAMVVAKHAAPPPVFTCQKRFSYHCLLSLVLTRFDVGMGNIHSLQPTCNAMASPAQWVSSIKLLSPPHSDACFEITKCRWQDTGIDYSVLLHIKYGPGLVWSYSQWEWWNMRAGLVWSYSQWE